MMKFSVLLFTLALSSVATVAQAQQSEDGLAPAIRDLKPAEGSDRIHTWGEESARLQKGYEAYLQAHPNADPATCRFTSTRQALEHTYRGLKSGFLAAKEKFIKEYLAMDVPSSGKFVVGLRSRSVQTRNNERDINSTDTDSYEAFKKQMRQILSDLDQQGFLVTALSIRASLLAEIPVSQQEMTDFLVKEMGVNPKLISYPENQVNPVDVKTTLDIVGEVDARFIYDEVQLTCSNKVAPTPAPPVRGIPSNRDDGTTFGERMVDRLKEVFQRGPRESRRFRQTKNVYACPKM